MGKSSVCLSACLRLKKTTEQILSGILTIEHAFYTQKCAKKIQLNICLDPIDTNNFRNCCTIFNQIFKISLLVPFCLLHKE